MMKQLSNSELRPTPGIDGYFASKDGRIFSNKRGFLNELRGNTNCYGHISVHLTYPDKTKSRYVHQLILETFVGPREDGQQCRHLNGNPADNRLENLCWGTASENSRDSLKHGVHPTQQPGYSKRLSIGVCAAYKKKGGCSEETKEKLRVSALKRYSDPREREKARKAALKRYSDPNEREKS